MAFTGLGSCSGPCSCSANYKTVSVLIYCPTYESDITCGGMFGCVAAYFDPTCGFFPAYGYGVCSAVQPAIDWLNDFAETLLENTDVFWSTPTTNYCTYAVFDVGGTSPTSVSYNNVSPGGCISTPAGSPGSGWAWPISPVENGYYTDDTTTCPTAPTNSNSDCATNPCFVATIIAVQTNCDDAQVLYQALQCCYACYGGDVNVPCTGDTGDVTCNSALGCWESNFQGKTCTGIQFQFEFVLPCPPSDTCNTLTNVYPACCGCGYSAPAGSNGYPCAGIYSLVFSDSSVNITNGQCLSPDPFGLT